MFTALTLFGVVFTALLAKQAIYLPIYALWIFLCGLGHYAVGFVLNIKLFKLTSALEIGASIALLLGMYFIDDLGNLEATFHYFTQGVAFAMLGVVPILMGKKLQKGV
jgi:hypothetical protein